MCSCGLFFIQFSLPIFLSFFLLSYAAVSSCSCSCSCSRSSFLPSRSMNKIKSRKKNKTTSSLLRELNIKQMKKSHAEKTKIVNCEWTSLYIFFTLKKTQVILHCLQFDRIWRSICSKVTVSWIYIFYFFSLPLNLLVIEFSFTFR